MEGPSGFSTKESTNPLKGEVLNMTIVAEVKKKAKRTCFYCAARPATMSCGMCRRCCPFKYWCEKPDYPKATRLLKAKS